MNLKPRLNPGPAERQMAASLYLPQVVELSFPRQPDPLPPLRWEVRPGGLIVGTRDPDDFTPGRPIYTAWRDALDLADLEPCDRYLRAEAAHTHQVTVRIAIHLGHGE